MNARAYDGVAYFVITKRGVAVITLCIRLSFVITNSKLDQKRTKKHVK